MAEEKKAEVTIRNLSDEDFTKVAEAGLCATSLKLVNSALSSVDIHNKDYVTVPERVKAFRTMCPDGAITTDIVKLENDEVVIRAAITDGNGKTLATGLSQESKSSSYINKSSYVENCVPLDTQILTNHGWKYYYQLDDDRDLVYGYNMEKQTYEFAELFRVNIYKNHPITELKTSRFCARCTPQHKWVVQTNSGKIVKRATEELKVSDKIIQGFPIHVEPSVLGRRLGWLMCDCELTRTRHGMPSTAYIRQSKYLAEVTELFGEPTTKNKLGNETWKDSYTWDVPADVVRSVLGFFDIATTYDLALAMASEKTSLSDVYGCFLSMMQADGTFAGEHQSFSSTYRELVEAVQIMCARLGIATTYITSRMCKGATKPIYTLSIKSTTGAYYSEMEVSNHAPQDVWCPTTATGTWIMKQGDFVTLTSNCETSAVGRALGFLGIGSAEIRSAEEMANAINTQEAQAKPVDKTHLKVLRDRAKKLEITEEQLTQVCGCPLEEITIDIWDRLMKKCEATEKARLEKEAEEIFK